MLKQTKKTFTPEFLNRLSSIIVFNDMDRHMASLILHKKLAQLFAKLEQRNVMADINDEAFEHLLALGFTKEYGAREIDRTVAHQLKPLFMNEILFGRLAKGGKVSVGMADGKFKLVFHAKAADRKNSASKKTKQKVR